MNLQLNNKVAAITGGNKGIGLAIAREFAGEGVHLALCARNDEELAEVSVQIRKEFDVEVFYQKCDVTNPEDISGFVQTINKKYGGADILINNAGEGTNEKITDAGDSKWQYYWDLHVMAAVRLSRSLIPLMEKRGGGVILNNASICATQPLGHEPIYNTTKAALVMFSKCLANECIPKNIRVNAVNPGLILTDGWKNAADHFAADQGISSKEYLENVAHKYAPIGRFARAEELASFFVFLASPKASYCVGSSYYVDGGWLNVVN